MRRVLVPASAVVALVCAGAALWAIFMAGLASLVGDQARTGADLLAQGVPSEAIARSLVRPGLHVLVIDARDGSVSDAVDGRVSTRPLPPPGALPGGELPPGPPGMAPPGAPGGPAAGFAPLAPPPARVYRGERAIVISPDARDLGTWLALDALAVSIGAGLIIVVAAARSAARARAQRAALEARIAERRQETERYQRFLAETGHELRTPLTVLAGYVDILRARDPEHAVDARILEGMYAEASRMRVLVEKMMTLARLEAHAAVPRLLDVGSAAREAAQTVSRRYPDRDVRVTAHASGSIVIDADDYSAALGNLLENAVKHAPGSPVLIETDVRGGLAVTSVIDEGPGVAPEDREAIFERFRRGSGRTLGEGMGLGLAIVQRIAERWGGSADCTRDGKRTIFRLAFPLADEERYGVAR